MDANLDLTERPDRTALEQVCRGMVEALSRSTAQHFSELARAMSTTEIEEHVRILSDIARSDTASIAASARFIGLLFVDELDQRAKARREERRAG